MVCSKRLENCEKEECSCEIVEQKTTTYVRRVVLQQIRNFRGNSRRHATFAVAALLTMIINNLIVFITRAVSLKKRILCFTSYDHDPNVDLLNT